MGCFRQLYDIIRCSPSYPQATSASFCFTRGMNNAASQISGNVIYNILVLVAPLSHKRSFCALLLLPSPSTPIYMEITSKLKKKSLSSKMFRIIYVFNIINHMSPNQALPAQSNGSFKFNSDKKMNS